MRLKRVAWNWTTLSLLFTIHKGRNPATGKRFLYVGVGPFLGFDFHWPEDEYRDRTY